MKPGTPPAKKPRFFRVACLSLIWLAATICALLFTAYPANASLALDTPDDQNYTRGTAITTLQLPEATGRGRVTSYTLTGVSSLPPGLNFNRETRRLSGTPQEVGTFLLTYTANNIFSSDSTNTTFTVTVNPRLAPLTALANQNYTRGKAITDLELSAATGGTAPLTYTLTGPGGLPAGLEFDAGTRRLSGTPQEVGTFLLTYTANNIFSSDSTNTTFTVTVNPRLAPLTALANQNYTRGKAITDLELSAATGGTAPLTYTLTGPGGLPAGLEFDAGTRTLSGTPDTAGTSILTYTVTDANGASTNTTFTVTVNSSLALDTPDDQNYAVDRAILDLQLPAATGGTAPLTYTLTGPDDSALPAGLTFTPGTRTPGPRTLSGTPNTAGTTNLIYTVTDANNASTTATFTVTVNNSLVLDTPDDQNYTLDTAIPDLQLPAATGGTGTLVYTLIDQNIRALPTGLSFDAGTRRLSGTPDTAGTITLTYEVTDTNGASTNTTFTVTVNSSLALDTPDDQNYAVDRAILDLQLPAATGGTAPLTYTLTGPGGLPAGLEFDAGPRRLSGTPNTAGTTTLTYTVTDANGANTTATFTVTVNNSLVLDTPDDQNYTRGTAIPDLQLPAATGGTAPLTYTLVSLFSSLSSEGLNFNPGTRTLSGTPNRIGDHLLIYEVRDANNASTSVDFRVTVNFSLALDTPDDQNYAVDRAILDLQLPAATGGTAPLTYTLTGPGDSALPAGLIFDPGTRTPGPRRLSGTPSALGTTLLTYKVTDTNGASTSVDFTVTVNNSLVLDTPDDQNYTQGTAIPDLQLPAATGGAAPLTYTLTGPGGDPLPAGLIFDPGTRILSGTPSRTGTTALSYTATDANNASTNEAFTVTVKGLGLDTPDDQNYTRSTAITDLQLPAVTGGTAPLTYTLTGPGGDPLPAGLIFDPGTRTLSGTPSALGTTLLTYKVTDTNGASTSVDFTVTVNNSLGLDTPDDQNYTRSTAITDLQLPAATGGTGTLTYTLISSRAAIGSLRRGRLPFGLTFNASTRTLSGTPVNTRTDTLTYRVSDTNGASTSVDFTVTVNPRPYLVNQNNERTTLGNQNYAVDRAILDLQLPAATGGTAPLTYTLTGPGGDPLPAGLIFDPGTRILSGTPSRTGTTALSYTATDANNASTNEAFTVTVKGLGLDTPDDQNYTRSTAITDLQLPAVTGGTAPLTYTLTGPGGDPLPAGLIFDPGTRTLSGTPSTAGTTNLTYTVTDANNASTSVDFTVTVNAGLALNTSGHQNYTLGRTITGLQLPEATGGTGTLAYTLTGVPAGLSFNASTRILSGTPSTAGNSILTYMVTDANDASTATFTVTVNSSLTLTAPANQNYSQFTTITDLQLPAATGGIGTLTYTLTGLPLTGPSGMGSLIFDPGTRILSGTPQRNRGGRIQFINYTLIYTVMDATGANTSVHFTIRINHELRLLPLQVPLNYMRGTAITDLQLPVATGGAAPLTYTLTWPGDGTLPAGLSYNADTRTLSGTPNRTGSFTLTYTVTDINGASRNTTFRVSVSSPLNTLILNKPADENYTRFTAIPDLQLPAVTGGTAPLTYTLTGLPAGLSFDPGTHTLSGTPSTAGNSILTYMVTDANGASTNTTFTVTVNAGLALNTSGNQNYMQGTAIPDLQLPAATGGTGTLVYTLTGLPAGLIFDPGTRTLSGTPSRTGTTALIYTATETNGASRNATFTVTVNADLGLDTPANQSYAQDAAIPDLQLPAATGGTAALTYTLTALGGLPAGLSFNASTRTLSGTPSTVAITALIYRVSDANNASRNATFTVTVNSTPSIFILNKPVDENYTRGIAITDLQLPAATGSTAPLIYTLTAPGGLPAGLEFDADTRILSGTPSTTGTTTLTYRVSDTNGASTNMTFRVTVNAGLALNTRGDQNYMSRRVIDDLTLPAATGGTGPLTYTLTGVPPGLIFDPGTRTLSGTPSTNGTTVLIYTVTGANDASANTTFTVIVSGNFILFTLNTNTPDNQFYTLDTAIPDLQLPAATEFTISFGGGSPTRALSTRPLTYTLTGLPAGLSFNANTRTLSGTPSTAGSFTLTYTAFENIRNSEGLIVSRYSANPRNTTFTVTVRVGLALNASGNQNYRQFTAIPDLQLPAATGGTAPLTYTLTAPGGLPAGLSFNANTRTLSGTPSTHGNTTLTYKVTDANNASKKKFFLVTVSPPQNTLILYGKARNYTQYEIFDENYTLGTKITDLQLQAATGGTAPLTYTLTGSGDSTLPGGLEFNADTRTLSGTPSTPGIFFLTYTVTDANNLSQSVIQGQGQGRLGADRIGRPELHG